MTPARFFRKAIIFTCCLLTLAAGVATAQSLNISDKLLQAFKQTFPDAVEVKWVEEPTKYSVSFKQNDVLTKIEYDLDGNFMSSLRYYKEKNLPVTILCRLQKKYPGKSVFGVTELATEAGTEYYIKLQDDKYWLTVHSDGSGNLQMTEKYKKAS